MMVVLFFAAASVLLLIYMWIEAHLNRVVRKELFLEGLPDEFESFTIFFISDLHNRRISESIIDEVKGVVDIVVIGGDVMEKGVSFEKVQKNLEDLRKVAPCYFVWGNNDYEEDPDRLERILVKSNITILKNTSETITKNKDEISLVGIDDLSTHNHSLQEACSKAKAPMKILISHNPDIKHELTNDSDIKLLLSGHTHGGQIRLLGWGLREKGGIKQVGGTTVVISNGYGTTTLPLRLMAPAESHVFTLKRK
ncbi:metallophosphoesterase [Alkalihalobacillus sp. CinArs1]|uniref:metallophosphoesterase n=1 Tax=Alkalihalobacillus sp. CinArs1 TaxID=2995314 RepID=UPI0022DD4057|nr:metallophosphoesterase [Alkalihalobacillus sp. CinArs1]